jgi:pimeloyl-ACP methyl ester carboxylesterase
MDGLANQIVKPFLVVSGGRDRLLPPHHAERLAREAPGAELVIYDDGNHGITNRPYESRSMMADWLADHL